MTCAVLPCRGRWGHWCRAEIKLTCLGPPAVHSEASLGLMSDSAAFCFAVEQSQASPCGITTLRNHSSPRSGHSWHPLKDMDRDPNIKSTVALINPISSSSLFPCPLEHLSLNFPGWSLCMSRACVYTCEYMHYKGRILFYLQ